MSQFSKIVKPNYLKNISFRVVAGVLILALYIFLWRPARLFITEQVVHPQTQVIETDSEEFISTMESGSLFVAYQYGDSTKELQYRPQFGFFFLIAFISLLFVTASIKPYLILGGIHLAGSVLAYLFLMAGFAGLSWGFVLTDAINGYLVPGLSLALVPLVIKGMIDIEK